MNRFIKSGSRLFLLVSWVFIGSLFADAANLDDLFSANDVIHDDDEVTAGSLPAPPAPEKAPLLPTSSHHAVPSRVIVDQDSPSLPADTEAVKLLGFRLTPCADEIATEVTLTAENLHIKLRTLLI